MGSELEGQSGTLSTPEMSVIWCHRLEWALGLSFFLPLFPPPPPSPVLDPALVAATPRPMLHVGPIPVSLGYTLHTG